MNLEGEVRHRKRKIDIIIDTDMSLISKSFVSLTRTRILCNDIRLNI